MKLIDKDKIAAEIEKRLKEYRTFPGYQTDSNYMELCEILSFINTLEVKEVDLDKIVDDWYNTKASKEFENVLYSDIENCAKYFFELGLMHRKDNLYGNKY